MTGQSTMAVLKRSTAMAIGGGVVMILLGFLVVFLPSAVGIGTSVVLGRIIVISGFAYLVYAFAAQTDRELLWRLLLGLVYVFPGFYLLASPGLASRSLIFLVAAIVSMEGLLELIIFSQFRPLPGSGWILFDGIATLFLACLILRSRPSSSTWAIATLLGINIIVSGFTRLMYSVTAHKTMKATA